MADRNFNAGSRRGSEASHHLTRQSSGHSSPPTLSKGKRFYYMVALYPSHRFIWIGEIVHYWVR